jgi:hypothetical protein
MIVFCGIGVVVLCCVCGSFVSRMPVCAGRTEEVSEENTLRINIGIFSEFFADMVTGSDSLESWHYYICLPH